MPVFFPLNVSWRRLLALTLLATLPSCAAPHGPTPVAVTPTPRWTLACDARWILVPPAGRFDASALLRLPDGSLLTLNDKTPPAYAIELGTNHLASLVERPALFPLAALRKASGKSNYIPDLEGLARDESGRLYLCTENERWIFRTGPNGGEVERLDIDWSPVARWFSKDANASWEGIAVGGGRLYLANERSTARIVVVDLATLKVVDDFQIAPAGTLPAQIQYSDLCWKDGELWILCRQMRSVLRIDPHSRRILGEYDYRDIELARENAFLPAFTYGLVEGLSVDDTHIWLCVDNNGLVRRSTSSDDRPLLFRCPRPDVPVSGKGSGMKKPPR